MKSDIKNLWDDEKVAIPTEIENHKFSSSFDGFKQLYDAYRGIQSGTAQDIYGWMYPKDGI